MSDLRIVLGAVTILIFAVVWFAERELLAERHVHEYAAPLPNAATGQVYKLPRRGEGDYYVTKEQSEALHRRRWNTGVALISIFTLVFGVIPMAMLLFKRRRRGANSVPTA